MYRSVGLPLPSTLPQASERVRRAFVELVAEIHAARSGHRRGDGDGEPARVSRSSVAGSWGAVAGTLRYFADRWGVSRAAIEGTQIPMDVIRKYATRGAGTLVYQPRRHGAPYAMQYPIVYRGFALELEREAADETPPPAVAAQLKREYQDANRQARERGRSARRDRGFKGKRRRKR